MSDELLGDCTCECCWQFEDDCACQAYAPLRRDWEIRDRQLRDLVDRLEGDLQRMEVSPRYSAGLLRKILDGSYEYQS